MDSTNSELMRRAHTGRYEPVLLVAQRKARAAAAWGASGTAAPRPPRLPSVQR